jgi:hypothetical protein
MTSCPLSLSRQSLLTALRKETSNIHWKGCLQRFPRREKEIFFQRKREEKVEGEIEEESRRKRERKQNTFFYEERH